MRAVQYLSSVRAFMVMQESLICSFPEGLEDVSKYPALIQELLQRNWTEAELAGVLRLNFIRVFEDVERVSGLMNTPREIPLSVLKQLIMVFDAYLSLVPPD